MGAVMNKLQKFNTIMLAVIGSGFILFIIGILIFMAIEYFSYWNKTYDDPLTNQEVKNLIEENIFTQTISYNKGYWAWTETVRQEDGSTTIVNSPYFVIPVSQITLKNDQVIEKSETHEQFNLYKKSPELSIRPYGLKHNNILIYNSTNGTLSKIFNKRTLIHGIGRHNFNSEHFMILRTNDLSAPKQNYAITRSDVYIYKFIDQSLIKLNIPEIYVQNFIIFDELPFILIRGKVDFDKNGKIDKYDPVRLYAWNFETNEIKPFPNEAMTEELQRILDGRSLKDEKTSPSGTQEN